MNSRRQVSKSIDLESMRQALLVGKHLSFRRAAHLLGVRQSTVSRRVRAIEEVLGVSLFERHQNGTQPTAAGIEFLSHSRSAIETIDRAIELAGAAGRGEVGQLRIGICSSICSGFLNELLHEYCRQHPRVTIQISEIPSCEQIPFVYNRHLDVAFVANLRTLPNCEVEQFWQERLALILPREHAFDSTAIEWEAFQDELFILSHLDCGSMAEGYLSQRFSTFESRPNVQKLNVGYDTLFHLVSIGFGISLTSEAATASSGSDIKFRSITDPGSLVSFSGAWLADNDNPALRRFLSLARISSKRQSRRLDEVDTTLPVELHRA